jgi:hypothetical protein
MRDTYPAGDSAAWAAFLPAGAVWLPGPHGRPLRPAARRLRRALAGRPAEARLAAAAPPWALGHAREAGGTAVMAYIAIPSRRHPVLVCSGDPAALRYVAESVLSVPPGAGPVASMGLTAGLRLLRVRPVWMLVAALRAGGVVLVGHR